MGTPHEFMEWISHKLNYLYDYSPPTAKHIDPSFMPQFDFVMKRSSSFLKGSQYQFYKVIPSNLTIDQARQLRAMREAVVSSKSALFKLFIELIAFVYVTDKFIPIEILNHLGDFRGVNKKFLGNIQSLNFMVETNGCTFLSPDKLGYYGIIPLQNLRDEVYRILMEYANKNNPQFLNNYVPIA